MKYRLAEIFPSKSYIADYTETIDLNVADPISQLMIQLDVTNVGAGAIAAHAIACLTKIELVDGSDVLFSLSGYQAEAVDIYHNGKIRSNWNCYLDGNPVQRFIGLNFGRKLWDPILAFDPKKFRNPQLKLTLDINAGGMAATPNKLQVWANLFDEKTVTPIGMLMHKEIKAYSMGSASHEYTDMPTDFPYRKLFVRAQRAGYEPSALISKIKLYEDEGKRIVINTEGPDNMERLMSASPLLTELIMQLAGTSTTAGYCTPAARVLGNVNQWAAAVAAGASSFYDGDGGQFHIITETGGKNVQVVLHGWLPHATYQLPFGDQDDIEDWYDVSKIGSLKLDVLSLAAGSGYTNDIFLQQLRKY
jgi:hypothetical protein